ncbi:g3048 [Coccomyxa elongata]
MATQASAAPSFHVLQYKYVPDILEKRTPFREAHLSKAGEQAAQGRIILGGALAEPVDSALFVWKNSTTKDIEEFVKADPYVINGLVTDWSIRPYMVMIGQ